MCLEKVDRYKCGCYGPSYMKYCKHKMRTGRCPHRRLDFETWDELLNPSITLAKTFYRTYLTKDCNDCVRRRNCHKHRSRRWGWWQGRVGLDESRMVLVCFSSKNATNLSRSIWLHWLCYYHRFPSFNRTFDKFWVTSAGRGGSILGTPLSNSIGPFTENRW